MESGTEIENFAGPIAEPSQSLLVNFTIGMFDPCFQSLFRMKLFLDNWKYSFFQFIINNILDNIWTMAVSNLNRFPDLSSPSAAGR